MVCKCSVVGCKSGYKSMSTSSKITFHKFPLKNERLLALWCSKLSRQGFTPTEHSRVCSLHFPSDSFDKLRRDSNASRVKHQNPNLSITKLKPGTVPTIFPDIPPSCKSRTSKNAGRNFTHKKCLRVYSIHFPSDHSYVKQQKDSNIAQLKCKISNLSVRQLKPDDAPAIFRNLPSYKSCVSWNRRRINATSDQQIENEIRQLDSTSGNVDEKFTSKIRCRVCSIYFSNDHSSVDSKDLNIARLKCKHSNLSIRKLNPNEIRQLDSSSNMFANDTIRNFEDILERLKKDTGVPSGYTAHVDVDKHLLVIMYVVIVCSIPKIAVSLVLAEDLSISITVDGQVIGDKHYCDILVNKISKFSELVNLMARFKYWKMDNNNLEMA